MVDDENGVRQAERFADVLGQFEAPLVSAGAARTTYNELAVGASSRSNDGRMQALVPVRLGKRNGQETL